jgi:hypothetical protein
MPKERDFETIPNCSNRLTSHGMRARRSFVSGLQASAERPGGNMSAGFVAKINNADSSGIPDGHSFSVPVASAKKITIPQL